MKPRISPLQLRRLQTLYSSVISRELGGDSSREGRLVWASTAIGRSIGSFSDLDSSEANTLIDSLQMELGQEQSQRPRMGRERAQAAGTEGRKRSSRDLATMVGADDLRRIHDAIARLGWTQDRFERWLTSSSSPLKGSTAIRTLGDANKVWWALKNILRREGRWKQTA